MRTKANHKSGFTLVEIMIVVAIIGLLAAIAIPNFIRARTKSQQNACVNNIRQIDAAIQQWALETRQPPTATLAPDGSDLEPFLGRGSTIDKVLCPSDFTAAPLFSTSYTITDVKTAPVCVFMGGDLTTPHKLNY
ncbi:MAG: type II secretion system protein [Verrucomicrobiota bacterium]